MKKSICFATVMFFAVFMAVQVNAFSTSGVNSQTDSYSLDAQGSMQLAEAEMEYQQQEEMGAPDYENQQGSDMPSENMEQEPAPEEGEQVPASEEVSPN